MASIEAGGSLGLILEVLDDLFGGRARIHLFDRTTRVLTAAGVDEPPITAPGPLHRALDTPGVVVEHVGLEIPAGWSAPYRAWLPRGQCHLVAARVEGGGEVVGVLSVVRSEHTMVPVAEDKALVGALAARLGRSAAVTLARASMATTRVDVHSEVDIDLRADAGANPLVIERLHETRRPESRPSPSPRSARPAAAATTTEAAPSADAEAPAVGAARLPHDAASALRLGIGEVETSMDDDEVMDPADEAALLAVLDALAASLADASPASGLRIDFTKSGGSWLATLRPRVLSEGWPTRPWVDDRAALVAREHRASTEVVADPDLGWLIEIRTGGEHRAESHEVPVAETVFLHPEYARAIVETESPDEPEPHEPDLDDGTAEAVDLMAASLGDTSHMLLIAVAADGRIVFCNDEMAARLGRPVADLLGRAFKTVQDIGGGWEEFGQLFARVIDEGLAQQTLSWPYAESTGKQVRWTVSRSVRRSEGEQTGPVYLCFGVEV